MTARVLDGGGSPVGGVPVQFTTPTTGASCVFPDGTNSDVVYTDSSGMATSQTCRSNSTSGTFTITANQIEPGVTTSPATFTETINTGGRGSGGGGSGGGGSWLGRACVQFTGPNAATSTSCADGYKYGGGPAYCNHDGNRVNMTSFAGGSSSSGDRVQITVQPNTCVTARQRYTSQLPAATNYHIYGSSGQVDDTGASAGSCAAGTPATDLTPVADQTVTNSTSPQTFTSTVTFSPGPGVTVICFAQTAPQAIEEAPPVNTNMTV